jgi:lysophospholipase L1-like esterase
MIMSPAGGAGTGVQPGTAGTGVASGAGAGGTMPVGTAGMGAGANDPDMAGTGGDEPGDPGPGMAGTGGDEPDPGMAGTGGDEPGDPEPGEDLGQGTGNDVITIGDSYMKLNIASGTEISLERVSGRNYRNYAVAGTRVLNGAIPSQFTNAKRENVDIKTVVMTGGGNDIIQDLLGNLRACNGARTEEQLSAGCRSALERIAGAIDDLINQMGADGVKDVIYVGYGYATNWDLQGTIAWTRTVRNRNCNGAMWPSGIRCHFVDPAEQLIGMISADGIHPNNAGYDVIGRMVWDKMQQAGVRR